jgi:ParB family chromosome partitioning protein
MLLRALVNLDPYTFADDVAEEIAGTEENETRTAEEVLLAAIDSLADEKLNDFTLRLALTSHVAMPRDGEFDFRAEAEAVFLKPKAKKSGSKKPQKPEPTGEARSKPSARKKNAA